MMNGQWLAGLALACMTGLMHAQVTQPAKDSAPPAMKPDPQIAAAIATIAPEQVQADIRKLIGFGTRSTLSSMETDLPPGHGILAAADWIESEFKAISAQCGGCLEVKRDEFMEQPAAEGAPRNRYAKPTKLVNVYAILHGSAKDAPWTLVTGHYDSRATDVMDAHIDAPGANDDGSGTAVSLECARSLSRLKLTGTIVFVTVAGEEQGLSGSKHLAKLAKEQGWPLEAALNDDIVGGDTTPGETMQDKSVVRVFSEGVPSSATPQQQRRILSLGAENDSPSRQLARFVWELAPAYFPPEHSEAPPAAPGMARSHAIRVAPAFHPVLVLRADRFLRSGDHVSFNGEGFPAIRFTEWRENFNHQHQTLRTENGVQYGDLLQFVDTNYVAHVARLNAATLASLAAGPSMPQNVRVLVQSLDNGTALEWDAPAFAPAGTTYEVLWRESAEMQWTHFQSAGTATTLRLDVSKDNVFFAVRAVDAAGHRSLAVAPMPGR